MNLKRSIRDLVLIAMYFSRLHFFANRNPPVTRILAFHHIPDKTTFLNKIKTIKQKANIVSFDDFINGRLVTDKINMVITFDDGFASQYENALPVLRENQIPAIFFISSGFIDSKDPKTFCKKGFKISTKRPMTWRQVKELSLDFDVGGHGRHHKNLAILVKDALYSEIHSDKKKIEREIKRKIRLFAYPFGSTRHISPSVLKTVKDIGYEYAFTIIPKRAEKKDRFLINRVSVDAALSDSVFGSLVFGDYELLNKFKPKR